MSSLHLGTMLFKAADVIECEGYRQDESAIHAPGIGIPGALKVGAGYAPDFSILGIPQDVRARLYDCMWHLSDHVTPEDIWVWLHRQPVDGWAISNMLRDVASGLRAPHGRG